jgi:hypothetical protein
MRREPRFDLREASRASCPVKWPEESIIGHARGAAAWVAASREDIKCPGRGSGSSCFARVVDLDFGVSGWTIHSGVFRTRDRRHDLTSPLDLVRLDGKLEVCGGGFAT